jgi:hypothetical protein
VDFAFAKNFAIRSEEVVMKINVLFAMLIWVCLLPGSASAQSTSAQPGPADGMTMLHHNDISMNHMSTDHQHGLAVPVSYAELTRTAALLETARHATGVFAPTNPTVQ